MKCNDCRKSIISNLYGEVNNAAIPIVSSVFSIKSKIFYFLFKIALKIDEKPSVIPSKPTTLAENGYTFDGR